MRVVLIAVGVVLAVATAWVVVASPFLDVDRVVVKGNSRMISADIEAAAQIHRGDAMVWIDGGAAVEADRRAPVDPGRPRRRVSGREP